MNNYNIIIAGVGGQGLVLTTKIICEAAIIANYDVKSNDVIGLSQRGGKVWGSVRIGEKINSPNIPPNTGDIIIGMEKLEAFRMRGNLKEKGIVIVNLDEISPVAVLSEKEVYPKNIIEELQKKFTVIEIDATEIAKELGSIKVMNTILLGAMASKTDIKKEIWLESIANNVPIKFREMNKKAFDIGYTK